MAARKRSGGESAAPAAAWSPPFHAAVARQGEPGREYSITDARGVTRSIRADADGVIRPASAEDVRLADAFGLAALSSAPAEQTPITDEQAGDETGAED